MLRRLAHQHLKESPTSDLCRPNSSLKAFTHSRALLSGTKSTRDNRVSNLVFGPIGMAFALVLTLSLATHASTRTDQSSAEIISAHETADSLPTMEEVFEEFRQRYIKENEIQAEPFISEDIDEAIVHTESPQILSEDGESTAHEHFLDWPTEPNIHASEVLESQFADLGDSAVISPRDLIRSDDFIIGRFRNSASQGASNLFLFDLKKRRSIALTNFLADEAEWSPLSPIKSGVFEVQFVDESHLIYSHSSGHTQLCEISLLNLDSKQSEKLLSLSVNCDSTEISFAAIDNETVFVSYLSQKISPFDGPNDHVECQTQYSKLYLPTKQHTVLKTFVSPMTRNWLGDPSCLSTAHLYPLRGHHRVIITEPAFTSDDAKLKNQNRKYHLNLFNIESRQETSLMGSRLIDGPSASVTLLSPQRFLIGTTVESSSNVYIFDLSGNLQLQDQSVEPFPKITGTERLSSTQVLLKMAEVGKNELLTAFDFMNAKTETIFEEGFISPSNEPSESLYLIPHFDPTYVDNDLFARFENGITSIERVYTF